LASGLECLQIRHDIRELIRIEPELRHRRMIGDNAFGQAAAQALEREFEMQRAERGRDGERAIADLVDGMALRAMASGLSLTLSMAWHCAQWTRTKVRPRCAAGDWARTGLLETERKAPSAMIGQR